jgi:hypothetical protein
VAFSPSETRQAVSVLLALKLCGTRAAVFVPLDGITFWSPLL